MPSILLLETLLLFLERIQSDFEYLHPSFHRALGSLVPPPRLPLLLFSATLSWHRTAWLCFWELVANAVSSSALGARPPVPAIELVCGARCPRSLAPPLLLLKLMLLVLLAVFLRPLLQELRDAGNAVRILAPSAARSRRVCATSRTPSPRVLFFPQGTGSLEQTHTELMVQQDSFHLRDLPDVI